MNKQEPVAEFQQIYDSLPKDGPKKEKKNQNNIAFDQSDAEKIKETISAYYGPVAWCNYCGGKHPRRACQVVPVMRKAKNGNQVKRYTRPELIDER